MGKHGKVALVFSTFEEDAPPEGISVYWIDPADPRKINMSIYADGNLDGLVPGANFLWCDIGVHYGDIVSKEKSEIIQNSIRYEWIVENRAEVSPVNHIWRMKDGSSVAQEFRVVAHQINLGVYATLSETIDQAIPFVEEFLKGGFQDK